jgi:hypothetical protein
MVIEVGMKSRSADLLDEKNQVKWSLFLLTLLDPVLSALSHNKGGILWYD